MTMRHLPPFVAPKPLIDRIPEDVRAFMDSTLTLLTSYMTGDEKLEFPVGRGITATITITGGKLNARVAEELMIQLSVYRRHLPETEDSGISATAIIEKMVERFEEHRRKLIEAGIPEPQTEPPNA